MTQQAPMTHRQRRKARDLVDRKRAAPNSFRAGTVPPIGHVFDDGEVFEGIPGGKVEPQSIGSTPMADDFLQSRHIPDDTILNNHVAALNANKITGQLNSGQIAGLDGSKLFRGSVPNDALYAVHGSKIVGNESIDWDKIKVSGVVFTHRLEETVRDLKRYMAHHYQKK